MLVTEGLAQAYQEFLYPKVKVAYAHHLTPQEVQGAWKKALLELDSKEYDHFSWFYGTGKLKRWTGYSLGYDIIRQYLAQNPAENPVTLVGASARKILQGYRLK